MEAVREECGDYNAGKFKRFKHDRIGTFVPA